MTSPTPRRGPTQGVAARDLKPGDYIPRRRWAVLAIQAQDGGARIQVNATTSGGLPRQKVFGADEILQVVRD